MSPVNLEKTGDILHLQTLCLRIRYDLEGAAVSGDLRQIQARGN